MDSRAKRRIAAASAAVVAVAGGGAAIAATQFDSPKQETQAIVNDAANQLGIQPTKLSDALKRALENRVDAAVAAGRITKAQGEQIKQRIESGELPIFGGPHGGPADHRFPHLAAAASYLGLSESTLQAKLEKGRTLAQVADDEGKSVDGLIDALVADEKKELAHAVADGWLTQAQADQLLKRARQRFTDVVHGARPSRGPGFGRPPFSGAPPPGGPDATF